MKIVIQLMLQFALSNGRKIRSFQIPVPNGYIVIFPCVFIDSQKNLFMRH